MRLGLLALAPLALARAAPAGQVLVVGSGPGHLPEIQAAVDAALDDDVILVKSGTYASFLIDNKSITVVADTGAIVHVNGAIRAQNLSADRKINLADLQANGIYANDPSIADGLFLRNCAGLVTVHDCTLEGFYGYSAPCSSTNGCGAEIDNCAAVSIAHSTVTGGHGAHTPTHSSARPHGLAATNSNVVLSDSTCRGGGGGWLCLDDPPYWYANDGLDGGDGIHLVSSSLFVARSEAYGGSGGQGNPCFYCIGGSGGAGLGAYDAACHVHRLSLYTVLGDPALGNCGPCGSCCAGSNGVATYFMDPASDDPMVGAPRSLGGPNLEREGSLHNVLLWAAAGDRVALAIGDGLPLAFDPAAHGSVLSGGPGVRRFIRLGAMAVDQALFQVGMPPLPAGVLGRTWILQSIHVDVHGARWVSALQALTIVSSSY
jgi:hypothetical protein